jgi:hypothetical protein
MHTDKTFPREGSEKAEKALSRRLTAIGCWIPDVVSNTFGNLRQRSAVSIFDVIRATTMSPPAGCAWRKKVTQTYSDLLRWARIGILESWERWNDGMMADDGEED